MRRILTAAVAAIEAAAIALATVALVGSPAALLWIVSFQMGPEPSAAIQGTAAAWSLSHLVPLAITLDGGATLALGLAPDSMQFAVTLAPLGVTLVTVALAANRGWRLARHGGGGVAGAIGGSLGFAAAATVVVWGAGDLLATPVWRAVLIASACFAVPVFGAYVLRSALLRVAWWQRWVRWVVETLGRAAQSLPMAPVHQGALSRAIAASPARIADVLRLAVALCAGLVVLGALGFSVSLVFGYVPFVSLSQNLQLDPLGALLVFLLHAALVPVAIAWSIAWFAGPGFQLGAGTAVTPFDQLLGPLPGLPLLGALPGDWGSFGALAPMLVVLLGALIGAWFSSLPRIRHASITVIIASPVTAAILAALAAAGVMTLASGSAGPGRLEHVGAQPWGVALWLGLELMVGALLGVGARRLDLGRVRELLPEMTVVPGTRWGSADGASSADRTSSGSALPEGRLLVLRSDAPAPEWGTFPDDLDDFDDLDQSDMLDNLDNLDAPTPKHEPGFSDDEPRERGAESDSQPEDRSANPLRRATHWLFKKRSR